ncbi:MAG: glycosyltransferase family 9 protein [Acidobacteria bacterium]|nr:glycosyltransferase family 9 protein [Acidobacteriota bacterium]
MARSILVVRLGALGDLVHALPAVAALRATWPEARIDWLVDERYQSLLAFVPIIDGTYVVSGSRGASILTTIRALRAVRYDVAIDFQGLLKSAVFARASGARDAVGFAGPQLRERAAGMFYTRQVPVDDAGHVIQKNLSVVRALGAADGPLAFPLRVPASPAVAEGRRALGIGGVAPFAVLNPGAGWPNKQWPTVRFGALAAHLLSRHGLPSLVLWGPRERALADAVAAASSGAAHVAPETDIGALLAIIQSASLFVAGDTGPLQLASALGIPVVGVYGPTNPVRNGPFAGHDICVSRFDECECHHKRQCRRETPCVNTITLDEVVAAADRRMQTRGSGG